MPTLILDPADVAVKTDALYMLSNAELAAEADSLASGFLTWIQLNFALTTEQVTYISNAPINVQKVWGYQFAATILTRGPLNFGILPLNPAPRRTKELKMNMFASLSYNDQDQELTGNIDTTLSFSLL